MMVSVTEALSEGCRCCFYTKKEDADVGILFYTVPFTAISGYLRPNDSGLAGPFIRIAAANSIQKMR